LIKRVTFLSKRTRYCDSCETMFGIHIVCLGIDFVSCDRASQAALDAAYALLLLVACVGQTLLAEIYQQPLDPNIAFT
jgi:hypothetical protein